MKTFNINRKWEAVVAIGCSHGHLENSQAVRSILGFVERFKPKHRIHLGDAYDLSAFRSGAKGTADEAKDVGCDLTQGRKLIREFRPTVFCVGNHENRAVTLTKHYNVITATAAQAVLDRMLEPVQACKATIIPYEIHATGWFKLGGYLWGHGHMYGENYLRDTAETIGNSVVAHAHRPGIAKGRRIDSPTAFGVGTLMHIQQAAYASGRRSTLSWGYGMVFGHVCGDKASLSLTQWDANETEFKTPL